MVGSFTITLDSDSDSDLDIHVTTITPGENSDIVVGKRGVFPVDAIRFQIVVRRILDENKAQVDDRNPLEKEKEKHRDLLKEI